MNQEDKELVNAVYGVIFFVIVVSLFIILLVDAVSTYRDCVELHNAGVPVVFQTTSPYCEVEVEISGKTRLLSTKEYYRIMIDE
jgi:hypothetical protein